MKKHCLFVSALFCTILLCGMNVKEGNHKTIDSGKASLRAISANNSENEIVTYVDVLGSYYNMVATQLKFPTKTFDIFMNEYYSIENSKDLYQYTYDFGLENGIIVGSLNSSICDFQRQNNKSAQRKSSSGSDSPSSGDADYILSKDTYSYTPSTEFKRAPYKSAYDYSNVLAGDIVYETETSFFNCGHDALIVDMNHSGAYSNYIQTIEAVGGGVQYGFLDDLRMTKFKVKILRVSGATALAKTNAIFFIKQQLGKNYNLNTFRLNTDINSSSWYCSELLYACYKYINIDIGVKKNANGNDVFLSLGCLPADIYNSYNTYSIYMPYYGFLMYM